MISLLVVNLVRLKASLPLQTRYTSVIATRRSATSGICTTTTGQVRALVAAGTVITHRPPRRSRRAALSGSSAIAGFRPHGSHRAALPQWALQKGPEAGRSLQPCLVDRRFREGEGSQELAVGRPVHAALLAAFAERLAPVPDDAFLEHTH